MILVNCLTNLSFILITYLSLDTTSIPQLYPQNNRLFSTRKRLQQRATTGLKNSNEQQQAQKTENWVVYFLIESELKKITPHELNHEGL